MRESQEPGVDKTTQRDAAYKAWRTIKQRKRQTGAEISRRLDEFITVKRITSITHPETQQRPARKYGVVIRQFDKTPANIVCGKFWELRWAYGCPLNCAYCYLRGTTRGNMTPRPVRLEHVLKALDEVFNDPTFNDGKPAIFNSGELCDSLMFPRIMAEIADKFEEQNRHRLLILTKLGVDNVGFLVDNSRKNTICAWSINAVEAASRWETAAPSPLERIKAAAMVGQAGYEIRVRIDPIFPIEDWQEHYTNVIDKLLSNVVPERIIIGTPRGLWKTIEYAKKADIDMSWSQYFDGIETGWGRKLALQARKEIYEFTYDKLAEQGYNREHISICKETIELFDALGIRYEPLTCQCYGHL